MKYILLIVIAFISVNLGSVEAQLLTKFKSKDALTTCRDYMKSNKGMTNPKLQFIGTFNEEIPLGEVTIPIEFDYANGTATGWGYFFVDADDTTNSGAVFAVKPIIGNYLTLEIPGDDFGGIGEEFISGEYIDNYDWMDSPQMLSKLKEYDDFQEFYNENKPFDNAFVILAVIQNILNEGALEPLWIINLSNEFVVRTCTIHAVNGEVFCSPIISSVEDDLSINFQIYPNPASDFLIINNNSSNFGEINANIVDMYGRDILNFSLNNGINELNISSLAAGAYVIRINNNQFRFIKQ